MVHHVNAEQYEELKATPDKLIIVDFSATWCGPCRFIGPKFEELSLQFPDVICIHVDIDELPDLEDVKTVTAVPTFMVFRNGVLLHRFSGANPQTLESAFQL